MKIKGENQRNIFNLKQMVENERGWTIPGYFYFNRLCLLVFFTQRTEINESDRWVISLHANITF